MDEFLHESAKTNWDSKCRKGTLLILVKVFKQQVSIMFSNDASIFHPKLNNSF